VLYLYTPEFIHAHAAIGTDSHSWLRIAPVGRRGRVMVARGAWVGVLDVRGVAMVGACALGMIETRTGWKTSRPDRHRFML